MSEDEFIRVLNDFKKLLKKEKVDPLKCLIVILF